MRNNQEEEEWRKKRPIGEIKDESEREKKTGSRLALTATVRVAIKGCEPMHSQKTTFAHKTAQDRFP